MNDANKPKPSSGNDNASATLQTSTVLGASDGLITESQAAENLTKRKDIADLTPEELEALLLELDEEEALEEAEGAEKAKAAAGVDAKTQLFDSSTSIMNAPGAVVAPELSQEFSTKAAAAADSVSPVGVAEEDAEEDSGQEGATEGELTDSEDAVNELSEEKTGLTSSDNSPETSEPDFLTSLIVEGASTQNSIEISIPEPPLPLPAEPATESEPPESDPPAPIQVEARNIDSEAIITEESDGAAILVGKAGALVVGSGDETSTVALVNGQALNGVETSTFQGLYGELSVNSAGDWSYTATSLSEDALQVTDSQLQDGLVAHWRFDVLSDNQSEDSATSDVNDDSAVLENGAGLTPTGFHGTALSLDGIDDRALISDSSEINIATADLTERTVSLAFRFDESNSLEGRQILYEEGGETGGVVVYLEDQVLYVGAHDHNAGWSGEFVAYDVTELPADQWHQVTLVLDSNANELTAFLDGAEIGTAGGQAISSHAGDISIGGPGEESPLLSGQVISSVNFESPDLGNQEWEIFNGQPVSGWTTGSGNYELQQGQGISPHEGNQWLELDGYGNSQDSLSYTIENNAGNTYTLELAVKAIGSSDINVYWGDDLITTIQPGSDWALQRIELPSFEGDTRALKLQEPFGQDDGVGALIDAIRLIENVPVSEEDNGYFQGAIDDVRIYDRALSDGEVEAVRYDFDQLTDHFDYTITNGITSSTGTLDVSLSKVPVAQSGTLEVTENSGYTVGQLQSADDDSDELIYELTSGPDKGFVTVDENGQYHFVTGSDFDELKAGDTEQVSFSYSVLDEDGNKDTATVQVNITGEEGSESQSSESTPGSLSLDSSFFQIIDGDLLVTEVSGQIVEQNGYTTLDKWHLNHEGGEFLVTLDASGGNQWQAGVRLYQSNGRGDIGLEVGEFEALLSPSGGSLQVITFSDLPQGHYQLVVGNQGFDESSVKSELDFPGITSGEHAYSVILSGNTTVATLPDDPGQNAVITGETYDQTEGILSLAVVNNDLNMVDPDNALYYEIFNDDVRVGQGQLDFSDDNHQQEISVTIGNESLETLTLDDLQLIFHEINGDGVSVNSQTFDFEQAATEAGEVIVAQGGDGLQGMELMALGLDYFELGFYEIIDDSQTQGL